MQLHQIPGPSGTRIRDLEHFYFAHSDKFFKFKNKKYTHFNRSQKKNILMLRIKCYLQTTTHISL